MANKTETRPRQGADAVDRSAVLRKVMEVLSAKGFAKASIADLKSAVGPAYGALHKAFGTRDEILRAADPVLRRQRRHAWPRSLCVYRRRAEKPFWRCWKRMCGYAGTGRDTVAASSRSTLLSFLQTRPNCRTYLTEKRHSLSKHIRARFARSVREGELPEGANCEALANLCLTLLSGLTFRVLDGAPLRVFCSAPSSCS